MAGVGVFKLSTLKFLQHGPTDAMNRFLGQAGKLSSVLIQSDPQLINDRNFAMANGFFSSPMAKADFVRERVPPQQFVSMANSLLDVLKKSSEQEALSNIPAVRFFQDIANIQEKMAELPAAVTLLGYSLAAPLEGRFYENVVLPFSDDGESISIAMIDAIMDLQIEGEAIGRKMITTFMRAFTEREISALEKGAEYTDDQERVVERFSVRYLGDSIPAGVTSEVIANDLFAISPFSESPQNCTPIYGIYYMLGCLSIGAENIDIVSADPRAEYMFRFAPSEDLPRESSKVMGTMDVAVPSLGTSAVEPTPLSDPKPQNNEPWERVLFSQSFKISCKTKKSGSYDFSPLSQVAREIVAHISEVSHRPNMRLRNIQLDADEVYIALSNAHSQVLKLKQQWYIENGRWRKPSQEGDKLAWKIDARGQLWIFIHLTSSCNVVVPFDFYKWSYSDDPERIKYKIEKKDSWEKVESGKNQQRDFQGHVYARLSAHFQTSEQRCDEKPVMIKSPTPVASDMSDEGERKHPDPDEREDASEVEEGAKNEGVVDKQSIVPKDEKAADLVEPAVEGEPEEKGVDSEEVVGSKDEEAPEMGDESNPSDKIRSGYTPPKKAPFQEITKAKFRAGATKIVSRLSKALRAEFGANAVEDRNVEQSVSLFLLNAVGNTNKKQVDRLSCEGKFRFGLNNDQRFFEAQLKMGKNVRIIKAPIIVEEEGDGHTKRVRISFGEIEK
ncbi:MAG: hypothetical protein ABIE74_13120 [Pseudomonadota bacterium]